MLPLVCKNVSLRYTSSRIATVPWRYGVYVRRYSIPRRLGRSCVAAKVPWEFGFQLNERYLQWDRNAQAQLVKLVAMDRLNLSDEELRSRLDTLSAILPDLRDRLGSMDADLLMDLVQDSTEIADRVVALKKLLPSMNVGAAISRYPEILARLSLRDFEQHVNRWVTDLDGNKEQVAALLSEEPRWLPMTLAEALAEVKRLMPRCTDPLSIFLSNPGQFLSMEQLGLESSN